MFERFSCEKKSLLDRVLYILEWMVRDVGLLTIEKCIVELLGIKVEWSDIFQKKLKRTFIFVDQF